MGYRLRSVDIGTLGAFGVACLYLMRVFWHSSLHGFTVTRQNFCLHSLRANLLAGWMDGAQGFQAELHSVEDVADGQ